MYTVKIQSIEHTTPKIRVLRVDNPLQHEFLSGQFFMISLPDHPTVKVGRAYSVASSPSNKEFLEFGFDKIGLLTTELFKCEVGDELMLKGPYGKFTFDEQEQTDILMIAAGTGITPMMSIVRCCEDKSISRKSTLLYSTKTVNELAYKNELETADNTHDHFTFIPTVTQEEWNGRHGRINSDLISHHLPNPQTTTCFLCGGREFVHQMITYLESLGVSKDQIKTDVW